MGCLHVPMQNKSQIDRESVVESKAILASQYQEVRFLLIALNLAERGLLQSLLD